MLVRDPTTAALKKRVIEIRNTPTFPSFCCVAPLRQKRVRVFTHDISASLSRP